MKSIYKKYFFFFTFISALIFFISCDKGIEPYPVEPENVITAFEGTVTFKGTWPEGITRTYIVVFSEPSRFDINTLQYLIGPIPNGATEYTYNSIENNQGLIPKLNPGNYPYVIVAQQKTEELSLLRSDWTVAGIYFEESNSQTPGVLKVEKGKTTVGINIICDFDNPPEQPPVIKFENE